MAEPEAPNKGVYLISFNLLNLLINLMFRGIWRRASLALLSVGDREGESGRERGPGLRPRWGKGDGR